MPSYYASGVYAKFGSQVPLDTHQSDLVGSSLDEYETLLLNSIDASSIDKWSYFFTTGLHVAGTNKSQAQWTADKFAEHGWTTPSLAEYCEHQADGTRTEFDLREAILSQDPTTGYADAVPTFHGLSFSGNATGELVYVGLGRQTDFDRLISLGVPLKGKIALARYGGLVRGLKIAKAQAHGMTGALIYTDPADDGDMTVANGHSAYPDGPARNPTAVERGCVFDISMGPGDPTTPGYPSKGDSSRVEVGLGMPGIPSLPLSPSNGEALLQLLEGQGISGKDMNRTGWEGALNSNYWTGPTPGSTITLENQMKTTFTWIWDAIGYINGTEYPDQVIILGNHRDSWIVGGAGDPNSGSACLIELSRAFGKLLATGWRPKRTIVLASWDGEEYGMYGSTEWVEEYLPWLKVSAVTYLNVDVAVSGSLPDIAGTPDLWDFAVHTMEKVPYTLDGFPSGTSLYDVWHSASGGNPEVLGSGSDFTAFIHAVGTSVLDVGSHRAANEPVYHYHSNFDSYHWMSTYGDPGFRMHKIMGSYLTLLVYNLASHDLLPLNPETYGVMMTSAVASVRLLIEEARRNQGSDESIDLDPLVNAIATFNNSAKALNSLIATARTNAELIGKINARLRDYQRGFISQGGVPGHEYFKHVCFAAGLETGYAYVFYPGISEQVMSGQWGLAREWVKKTASAIKTAAQALQL